MHCRWCTASDAMQVMHRRWCTAGDAHQVMHHRQCTAGDALQVMNSRWCTAGDASQVMHPRWCTAGDAPHVMHCRWCIAGDALQVMPRRWCTADDASQVMHQKWCTEIRSKISRTSDMTHLIRGVVLSGFVCLIVLVYWWFHRQSLSHALITGSCLGINGYSCASPWSSLQISNSEEKNSEKLLVTFDNLCQLFGNLWYLLATFGNLWQLLKNCGNFWQLVATFSGRLWQAVAVRGSQLRTPRDPFLALTKIFRIFRNH